MASAIRRESRRASSLSKGRRWRKNTSCNPMHPSPTGRQRRFPERALPIG